MSEITEIQWADSTVNPIMGCGGCELFPPPGEVLTAIDEAVADAGTNISSRAIFKSLVNDRFSKIENPGPEFKNVVNTTNIWHLREPFAAVVQSDHGQDAGKAAELAIRKAITCYAAKLHLNKGVSIVNPTRIPNKGYAPIFESVTQFAGRVAKTAKLPDLLGRVDAEMPWKQGLPRLVFLSDMGDALSAKADFPFLKSDVMPAIQSDDGKRHLWLWLTKRPERMAKFADEIGGFPSNVCAMTTITGPDPETLKRVDQLRQVKASCRGLSIEPLRERIPPSKLDLTGIDWVIVGGESGSGEDTRPFALECPSPDGCCRILGDSQNVSTWRRFAGDGGSGSSTPAAIGAGATSDGMEQGCRNCGGWAAFRTPGETSGVGNSPPRRSRQKKGFPRSPTN
jgi:protein gp37